MEAAFITANATGTVIVLSNWAGRTVSQLSVTVNAPVNFKTAVLATGGGLEVKHGADGRPAVFLLTEDFLVADAIILRL